MLSRVVRQVGLVQLGKGRLLGRLVAVCLEQFGIKSLQLVRFCMLDFGHFGVVICVQKENIDSSLI